MKKIEFEHQVYTALLQGNFDIERQPDLGGLRPDFVVHGAQGKRAVIELKNWDPGHGNTARAIRQVELYKDATESDLAFLVLDNLRHNRRDEGVVNLEGLLEELNQHFPEEVRAPKKPRKKSPRKRIVFAAMPYDEKYDDTFFVAMRHAAKQIDATCEKVELTDFDGDTVEEIKNLIKMSVAVIADLSESKPNVMYEVGFAHARNKPIVHICSTSLNDLPFNVRNWSTLEYKHGQTRKLRKNLGKRLKGVIAGGS